MIKVSSVRALSRFMRVAISCSYNIPGGVIVTQDFLDTLNLSGPEHTSLLGTVTALYDVGCFFGAVAAFSIGEMLGRKKSILLGTTVIHPLTYSFTYEVRRDFISNRLLGHEYWSYSSDLSL